MRENNLDIEKTLERVKGRNLYFVLELIIMGSAFSVNLFFHQFQGLMIKENNILCRMKGNIEYKSCEWKEACREDIEFIFNGGESWMSEYEMYCKNMWRGENLGTYFYLGRVLGVIGGILADRIGRKKVIIMYQILQIAFLMCIICAPGYQWLILPVIGMGFVNGNISAPMLILSTENVITSQRELTTTLLLMFEEASPFLFALFYYLQLNWRIMVLVPILVNIYFVIFFYFFIPQSPKFLLSKGREPLALQSIRHISNINGLTTPLEDSLCYKAEVENININRDRDRDRNINRGEYKAQIWHLFRLPHLRVQTIMLSILSIFTSSLFYGIPFFIPTLSNQFILNYLLLGSSGIISLFLAGKINSYLGKGRSLLLFGVISALSFYLFYLGGDNISPLFPPVMVLFGCFSIFSLGYTSYTMIGIYYPVWIKSIAYGVLGFSGRIASLYIPYAANYLDIKLYFALLSSGVVIIALLILTLKQPTQQQYDHDLYLLQTKKGL